MNLNTTQDFFIRLLKEYLNKRPIKLEDGIDFNELFDIARKQNMTAIVYEALKDELKGEVKTAFEKDHAATVFSNVKRTSLLNNIDTKFKENNINYFLVKGFKVAELYPNPRLRTMGDTDMIMSTSDREKANDLMVQLGFERIVDGMEWIYRKNGLEFELHDSLIYEDYKEKDYLNDFLKHTIKKEDGSLELDPNFHFVFLIVHLKKHILYEGIGFRQFVDIGLVTEKMNLDWKYIEETTREFDLINFTKVVLTLNNMWFGFDNPLGNVEIDEDFLDEITNRIFTYGVHGHDDPDIQSNKLVNNNDVENGNILITRIKYIFHLIYPTRAKMFMKPYMKFFADKPLLMPIAHIYRHIYLITHNLDQIFRVVFVSKDKIEKRTKELKNWGIK